MKIWGNIPKVLGVYDNKKNISKINSTAEISGKKDVVSISNNAKDFQTIMRAIKDIPDVRQEKVSLLSEGYESGNYDVSGKDTADRILRSVIDRKV